MPKTVILLIGPSSAGKTVILKMMLESGHKVGVIKTTSTRPLRANDYIDDVCTYESVSEDEFNSMIQNGEMIRFILYDNHYYGMRKSAVFEALKDNDLAVIGVNEESVEQYRDWLNANNINCIFCFVSPRPIRGIPDVVNNLAEVKSRMLHSRHDLTADQVSRRLKSAQDCLVWMLDNQSLSEFHITTWNSDFKATYESILELIDRCLILHTKG